MMSSSGVASARPDLLPTERLPASPAGVARAAELLRQGALVAFPTETVYGLGADAANPQAVGRVYAAKNRPPFNPLIVHLSDIEEVGREVEIPPVARALAKAFWPGPLTLVLPRRADSGVVARVSAGLDTIAVRVPDHPVALALLRSVGGPLVGPSANPSGSVSPTHARHVLSDLDGKVDAVLDAGDCRLGIESTIVGFQAGEPVLLRSGALAIEAIARILGRAPAAPAMFSQLLAPGGLPRHYAPSALLRLGASAPESGEAWLGFGADPAAAGSAVARENLSPDGDLGEAATRLYHCIRVLDKAVGRRGRIAVASLPATGSGLAINDRLRRAAARDG